MKLSNLFNNFVRVAQGLRRGSARPAREWLKQFAVLAFLLIVSVGNVCGADETITIKKSELSSLTDSYDDGATKTDDIGNVTFTYSNLMYSSSNIQARASTGNIYNSTLIPGKIKSVAITHSGTGRSTTIFMGTSSSSITTQAATGSGSITGSTPSNMCPGYFKITRGSNAAYWSKVVVTYTPATITLSTSSISGLNYNVGSGQSAEQSFTVSGSNIPANLTVTAPTDFQVKVGSGSWGNSATITVTLSGSASAGTLSSTTVYVRLASGKDAGNYDGDVSIAMTGCNTISSVNPKTVAVSGTVTAAACGAVPTVSAGSLKGSVSSSSSATVQCTSGVSNIGGAGCSMTSYGFAVGTSANPTIGGTLTGTGKTYEVGSSIAASTGFEKLIDGLAANTTYHVRSYATNGAGTGYGDDFTFTTLAACTAAPTVTEGSKGTITSTTAAVTCSSGISSLGTGGCEITSYGFVYGTSANPTTSNSTKEVGKTYTSTGASFNTSLTGLTEGQIYYVRPYATNGFDTNYGTQVSFGTPKITVSETARAFGDRAVGGSYTMTFTVSGTYLQGNISIAKSGTNQAMFSIDNATVTQTDGTAPSTTITVTYSPSAAGSHSATLTLSSTNATSKTVALSGTGKYKVTWMAGGSVFSTQVADANTALSSPGTPSPATYCPGGKVFVGWSANTIAGTSNTQPTDLFTDATKKKMPAGGITYYAVYATSTGSSSTSYAAITSGLASGNYVIAYEYNNNGTRIALQNIADNSDASNRMEAYALARDGSGKYANPSDTYIWQLQAQDGGGYYIYDLATGMYLNATTSALQLSTTPTKYDIAYDGTNSRWTIQLNSNSSYYVHGYTGTYTDFRVSTSGSDGKYRVYLYKNEGTQTFSAYATTCCTNLDDINGAITFTNPTTAVVSWDNIANVSSWTVKYKVHGSSWNTWAGEQTVYTKTTSNDSRKVTITSLTPCANYDFQIIASPASGYCDKDQTINDTQTNSYSVLFPTLTGTTKSSGTLTSCASENYVATFTAASVAYELPDESGVTVTIGGSPATITTDYTWSVSNGTGTLTVLQASITGDITISVVSNSVTCESTPTLGAASLSGTFNLTTVGVSCASITPGTYCAVESEDYGFIWYSGTGNKVIGNDGVTKVAITSGDYSSGSFAANLSGEFTTGTTYSYRAFAENTGDNVGYSTTQTFKPQSVTFNKANGEDNVVTYVNYNTAVSEPSAPSKTGYEFVEWQLGGSEYDLATAVTSNITLTATWNALTYEVTLAKDYGSAGSNQVTATFGSAMPDMGTKPSRSGYTFQGYFDDHNGAGTKYYNSDKSSARNWDKATNTTLYASWSPKNYTITLNNQGADAGHGGTANISVTYDSNTNLSGTPAITKPEKTGYVFAGYYTAADGGGSKIIDENGNVVASVSNYTSATKQWIKANSVELHAYWKPSYTVTWSVNGETSTEQVVSGDKVAALPTAPTKSDCDDSKVFVGWRATAIDGISPSDPGSIFTTQAGSPAINSNVTFYAVFADVNKGTRTTLYNEPFKGTCSENTDWASASSYFDDANTSSIVTTDSWKVSKYTTETSEGGYTGASGGSHTFCGSSGKDIVFNFGDKSAYLDLQLSFGFRNNAGGGSSRSISCTISGDGGDTWGSNIIDVASITDQSWHLVSYDISNSSTSSLQVKWTATAANPSRVDDIKLTGCLITYSNYVTSCSSCVADATFTNTTPAVSEIGCTSATLTMEDGLATLGAEGCNISDYGFVIGTSDNPAIGGSGVTKYQVGTSNPTIGDDFSYEATDLTKGTHYYIRAYATNRHGTAYSSSQNFWTKNVSSIAITTAPTKTNYIVGETFDATGMEVTATMANGSTEAVTGDVTYSGSALTAGTSQNFAINYTLCETAKSVNQVINVYTLTVTEGANPSYGTATNSSANIVSITGLGSHKTYTVTVTSDNAEVVDNGDNTWSVINPTGNVSVRVDYADAVQVKVYYKVDGVTVTGLTQDVYQSETTTLPTASELATAMTAQSMDLPDDEYPNFVGWSETEFSSQTSEPTIVSGTPAINAEKTYYAVFTNLSQVQIEYSITSGYAAEANKTIDGQTITYGYLYPGNNSGTRFIQFQKNATDYGRIYNSTSMANLIKLEAGYYNSESAIPVYACSAAGTITGSAISAESHEGSDPYVYTFPSNTSYFMVKGNNSTTFKPKWLKIYYCSSTVYYMTQFCTRYDITGASTSGTDVIVETYTAGRLTSNYNSACEGKSVQLEAIVNSGYQFSNWTINKTADPTQDVTSTLLPGANATSLTPAAFSMPAYAITVSATITAKEVTGWTWKQELADASEINIPATVELYIGQQARFNLKTYDPADVIAGKKGYDASYTNTDLAQDSKAGAYYVTRGKIAKESTTLTLTSTSNGSVQEVITIRIKALPLVHFVDNIHGETFDDVVANVDASEKRTVYTTKTTPTHSDVSDPGESYNACERNHLHLIGWILSTWAEEHPGATHSEIIGAGSGKYYAAGASINVETHNGDTFYAVWSKIE